MWLDVMMIVQLLKFQPLILQNYLSTTRVFNEQA